MRLLTPVSSTLLAAALALPVNVRAEAAEDPSSPPATETAPVAPPASIAPVAPPAPIAPPAPTAPPQAASAWGFDFHGYYRARVTGLWNAPVARLDENGYLANAPHTGRDDASSGTFFANRLRLEPAIRFGGGEGTPPKAAVYAQLDLLDNVVWGDNARRSSVPLFASNPTRTGIDGVERPDLLVRRLWLELSLPVGQLRLGRQASHGGLGILFNDGNGFRNDFGDAEYGTTFDRLLFATRPLTILRAITRGDRRETPLVWLLGYDRLVQDTLGFGSTAAAPESRTAAGPFGWRTAPVCGGVTAAEPNATTPKCDVTVGQLVTGLIWRDESPRWRRDDDELTAGAIYVRRSQGFTESTLHIIDAFWRLKLGLWEAGPSLLTEGEVAAIRGTTRGIKLLPGGLFDDRTGLAEKTLEGDILNYAARAGLTTRRWDALLEVGHSSGDEQLIGDPTFKMYPMSPDYRMGLLMYPVALHARSFNTLAGRASGALHGGGGVFNSTYLNVKGRYRFEGQSHQVELIGQGVFGWADTLNGGKVVGFTADYYSPRDPANPWEDNRCAPFDPACALGMEFDVALRLKWLPVSGLPGMPSKDQYRLHWSNEFGVMAAGAALAPRLAEGAQTLWTAQSRLAVVW
jgi:hypothetical protein